MKTIIIHRKGERGQSFMELAISLVFLIMLLSVVIDLGWAFYTLISLRDTVQEAASFGSMCTKKTMVEERFKRSASSPIDMNQVAGVIVCYSDRLTPSTCKVNASTISRGDDVTVTVNYQHQIMTPFIGAIINTQSYPLQVTISNTVLQTDQAIACK